MRKNKELRKLKRSDLLELMLQLQKEVENLKTENELLRQQLDDKTVTINKTGNIAEAAMLLTNVFEEAQKAAEIYLTSIRSKEAETERITNEIYAEKHKCVQRVRIEHMNARWSCNRSDDICQREQRA